jgi:hypothetical protein
MSRQLGQTGPLQARAPTGRRRSQRMQISWLAGSTMKQFGQIGRPRPSRVTGSRTAPQRAQGTARRRVLSATQDEDGWGHLRR